MFQLKEFLFQLLYKFIYFANIYRYSFKASYAMII